MAQYVLEVSYKGTHYAGWQSQLNAPSIEGELQKALERVSLPAIRILSSSRTDAGVHALQQIVRVDIEKETKPAILKKSLNAVLPADIAVRNLAECSADFHPTHSAKKKLYTYTILNSPGKSPFFEDYVWRVSPRLDLESMQLAATSFIGEHDFTYFCAVDSGAKTRVRHIYDIQINSVGSRVTITVLGKGFLKQMIRKMVGTLVEVGKGKRPPSDIKNLLTLPGTEQGKGRSSEGLSLEKKARFETSGALRCGITAPAQGLCLTAVLYDRSPFEIGDQE